MIRFSVIRWYNCVKFYHLPQPISRGIVNYKFPIVFEKNVHVLGPYIVSRGITTVSDCGEMVVGLGYVRCVSVEGLSRRAPREQESAHKHVSYIRGMHGTDYKVYSKYCTELAPRQQERLRAQRQAVVLFHQSVCKRVLFI